MSVMVTGGAGYIGSHMILDLIDSRESLVVLDDLSAGFRWAVPDDVDLVVGDIGDQALVARIIDEHAVDSVIHFASSTIVPESTKKPLLYYDNNTSKALALIEVSVRKGVRNFIFSSSAAVYGVPKQTLVTEDAPLQPISPYGSSKMMTELILRDTAAAHDLRYVALRYFNVAGADPAGRSGQSTATATHLIKAASQVSLGMRPFLTVFGSDYPTHDGTCIRDYIHVSDLVHAHSVALQHLRNDGESRVLNCGYGRGYSVLEVIAAVKQVSGMDFKVRMGDRRPGDAAELVAQSDRLTELLGWVPKYNDLPTIVEHALAWEATLRERLTAASAV